ncbi:glycerophosphodiester phosphodiesterase [Nocardioides sp. YIM 152315]|uniref:glycerophosphodiester phosphodiesterase n=1 Tax=Nocardioides sp. YIM 152315 TaxID=3031760 RepID=UPI0023DC9CBD|nr:glycerophosphodiester phosphodiesterase [Nocardioides sp. YIM 152315]MDF1602397.1 glycerophosphodiester phosphodiesterase [Nocardioides sp. YIM 152315]
MRLSRRHDPILVSAHRCLTRDAIEAALRLGVDYVEFDLQRCADGTLVVHHDPVDAPPRGALTFDDALDLLTGRSRAHLDVKFVGDGVVDAVAHAVARLGTDRLIVTTLDDRSVAAVRDWSDRHAPALLVGLSLGRGVTGSPVLRQIGIRVSELWPGRRYGRSRANLVVAHHWLARLTVARFARRHRLPLLVWTVDTAPSLRHWTRTGRAWLVTTNHPDLALRLRRPERLAP